MKTWLWILDSVCAKRSSTLERYRWQFVKDHGCPWSQRGTTWKTWSHNVTGQCTHAMRTRSHTLLKHQTPDDNRLECMEDHQGHSWKSLSSYFDLCFWRKDVLKFFVFSEKSLNFSIFQWILKSWMKFLSWKWKVNCHFNRYV